MGITKDNIAFSAAHSELVNKSEAALKKVSKKIIAEAKANDSFIVVADKDGKVKKMYAKDL